MKIKSISNKFYLKNSSKIKVFLFFLGLTFIIWLFVELSKVYVSTATFKIRYTNLPSDKIIQKEPVSEIELMLRAPGFSLLKYKIRNHSVNISLGNLNQKKSTFYIIPKNQISLLNNQISGDTEVVNTVVDTIFLELGRNISKKVPVIPRVDIDFKLGYNFVDKMEINPDSIIIVGPEKKINSIVEVFTEEIEMADVHSSIDMELDIVISEADRKIVFSEKKVNVWAEVDKFTEGMMQIPIKIINEPENVKILPFLKEFNVVYKVALSNFNEVDENSIQIVLDYNQFKNDTLIKYLTPIVQKKSDLIYSYKIIPKEIEFLIQK